MPSVIESKKRKRSNESRNGARLKKALKKRHGAACNLARSFYHECSYVSHAAAFACSEAKRLSNSLCLFNVHRHCGAAPHGCIYQLDGQRFSKVDTPYAMDLFHGAECGGEDHTSAPLNALLAEMDVTLAVDPPDPPIPVVDVRVVQWDVNPIPRTESFALPVTIVDVNENCSTIPAQSHVSLHPVEEAAVLEPKPLGPVAAAKKFMAALDPNVQLFGADFEEFLRMQALADSTK